MQKEKSNLYIFAFAAHGSGISGGDRIFIELARRWSKKIPIMIFVDAEGYEMCRRQNLVENGQLRFKIYNLGIFGRLGFVISYIARIILSLAVSSRLAIHLPDKSVFIYNASEFWMDSFPSIILKLRYGKNIEWIASWYQTAPNPLKGFTQGGRRETYKLSAFFYWCMQLPIKPFVKKYADTVIVNNEEEKKQFPKHTKRGSTIVLIGAVPLGDIQKYKSQTSKKLSKKYDAVFQGRFHPQKGVVELIDIWKRVTIQKPQAKLVMIGDGPLMEKVKMQIANAKLGKNVELLGYVFDGKKKYDTFA